MIERVDWYAENAIWYRSVRLYGRIRRVTGQRDILETVQVRTVEPNEAADDEPFLSITRESAQSLMDALWSCGLRPSEGQGSAGQLAAVKDHLNDMRRLVFDES